MPEDRQLDLTYLEDMSGGDREFIEEILGTFLETSSDLIESLLAAAKEGFVEKALYASHTLKGSSRSVGADPLGAICQSLEQLARSGDMKGFAELVESVPPVYAQLRAEIQASFLEKAA